MKKIALLVAVFLLTACDQAAESPGGSFASGQDNSRSGVVLEAFDVDSYSYMRLNVQGNEVWLASTPVEVSEGDTVSFSGEIMMTDFYSTTLDRTFPSILFVTDVQVGSAGQVVETVQVPSSAASENPHGSGAVNASAGSGLVSVEALDGGMRIAEIFANRQQLDGQEVSLRAQVVKFSPNILSKNWITLKDGTGIAPDDTLVATASATASATAAIGDVVVVTGKVRSDVDIGAGYVYKVLLEDSVIN